MSFTLFLLLAPISLSYPLFAMEDWSRDFALQLMHSQALYLYILNPLSLLTLFLLFYYIITFSKNSCIFISIGSKTRPQLQKLEKKSYKDHLGQKSLTYIMAPLTWNLIYLYRNMRTVSPWSELKAISVCISLFLSHKNMSLFTGSSISFSAREITTFQSPEIILKFFCGKTQTSLPYSSMVSKA